MIRHKTQRSHRHARIRAKVFGTADRPRLAVYRSNKYVYAQLIDDTAGATIAAADSRSYTDKNKQECGHEVGQSIAKAAIQKGVAQVVFDRGGFQYHGTIKAVADGAREGGLKF